ncbi:peptidyl-prolyl cis-trans isomerase [Candidatus Woesearchaeota archaeon]|nr:peptidyl-prolyl cis-trans isomerase [Candidatus Woesearchaeota archaeon]
MKLEMLAIAAVMLLIAGCSKPEAEMNPHIILETSKGSIEIELYPQQAPITAQNFLQYANEGFYDGTIFHRVIPGFMIQGGGFTPDGVQKDTHEPIKLESNNGLKNEAGTVAMARTMIPDSATGQFFINVAKNDFLNHAPGNDGYAVFGKVVKGMDIANSIAASRTGTKYGMADWPTEDVVIKKAYVK